MRPLAGQHRGRVRSVDERIVVRRPLARRHTVDLIPDRDHRVAEAIQLAETLHADSPHPVA